MTFFTCIYRGGVTLRQEVEQYSPGNGFEEIGLENSEAKVQIHGDGD